MPCIRLRCTAAKLGMVLRTNWEKGGRGRVASGTLICSGCVCMYVYVMYIYIHVHAYVSCWDTDSPDI